MTHCSARLAARLESGNAALSEPVRPEVAASALCMGDWILMAALCRTEAGELFAAADPNEVSRVWEDTWTITYQSAQALRTARQSWRKDAAGAAYAGGCGRAGKADFLRLPAYGGGQNGLKLTATQLKGRAEDFEAAEEAETPEPRYRTVERRKHFTHGALHGREKGKRDASFHAVRPLCAVYYAGGRPCGAGTPYARTLPDAGAGGGCGL